MGTVIITDSTCDLALNVRQQLNVGIVPLTVNFNNSSIRDGYDEKRKRSIYRHMRLGGERLMTSQPSLEEFLKYFNQGKENGDDVIYIGISSRSSGTLQAARIARSMCDYDKIHIVDSLQLSHGLQVLVRIACRLRDEGKSALEIVNEIMLCIP